MILRFFHNYCYLSTVLNKTKTMNLNRCYFRYIQEEDKINISFLLNVKSSARQFNFSRNPSENLQTLFIRMASNIQKVLSKGNKKKTDKNNTDIDIKIYDIKNKLVPESYTCKELFEITGPLTIKINENAYEAVFNAPWVTNINLPQSILAGFPIYPEFLKTKFTDLDKSTFNWYVGSSCNGKGNMISDIHIKWELAAENFTFTPDLKHIGMKVKLVCVPANDNIVGPSVEIMSKNVIEAGPGKCPFEIRHMFTSTKLENKSFRCVSYNILADLYCDSDYTRTVLHPYCPPYALHIDYRKQLIIKELVGYNADIICLQEVDCKIFDNYLVPIMKSAGLKGVFYKKGKEVAEGLACFYREKRFRIISEEAILLAEAVKTKPYLNSIWNCINTDKPMIDRLLDRSTVASTTVLQSIDNQNEILIVGNTHLYFHPDADHIRFLQGTIIIYWLMDMKKELTKKFPDKRISFLLFGDYNSDPSSKLYELFTSGIAPKSLPDWNSSLHELAQNLNFDQKSSLASACGTPMYTNYTNGFADCLDYIFYETLNLEVEQVIPFPSVEELKANTALPSVVFPSDHIAVISDLRFIL